MKIFQIKTYREIYQTILCVIGLWFMMIGLYIFTDKFSLSVLLGSIVGSAASILNYILNIITVQFSGKYNYPEAVLIRVISKVLRSFLMGFVILFILLFPILNITAGIAAMFFPHVRYIVIKRLRD